MPLPRLGLAGLLALAVLAPPAAAHDVDPAAAGGELPDLVADPVSNPSFDVDASEDQSGRLLLRFNSWVHNQGAGPLEIRRAPGGFSEQVFKDADAGLKEVMTMGLQPDDLKFENTDGHNHWHLQRIARYSLVSADGAYTVAPAMKVGFCLIDHSRVTGAVSQRYLSLCGQGQPNPTSRVTMGVSSGWRDLYDKTLPFQWVDVSDVLPGTYRLRSLVDPDDVVLESDEANNAIPADVLNQRVPGFNALARSSADGDATLAAEAVGGVTGPRYRVVDGPEHGTLDEPTGAWFSTTAVSSTATEPDRFTYVAADPGSAYPRYPGRATALLNTTAGVALSGVPEAMAAGVTVDLDATVVGPPGAVSWTTSRGTIDTDGRLTAPATGGTLTVTATGPGGEADAMDIRVVEPPREPEPAPTVPSDPAAGAVLPTTSPTAPSLPPARTTPAATSKPAAKRTPIGSVRVRRIGAQYAVAVLPRSTGRLRATLLKGTRRLATCTVRVTARRSALCRLKVRPGATAIAITLVRRTGATEHRRVRAPR